jgi:hypothetical protein
MGPGLEQENGVLHRAAQWLFCSLQKITCH